MQLLPLHGQLSATELAAQLGISSHACDLFVSSPVVDLHIESYSFYRSFGYDPRKSHSPGINRALLFNQADLPRLFRVGINGATWVITANPLRPPGDRLESFETQLHELSSLLTGERSGSVRVVASSGEFFGALAEGCHGAFLGVQGANALPSDLDFLKEIADRLTRVTLLHMSDSEWGCTSTPRLRLSDGGLSSRGFELVEALNQSRIFVDLAHIHPRGFWDAVQVHDTSLPMLVTHTGVSGVHPHWRNLDDAQLKAIANSGGVVGIMYHALYLGDPLFSGKVETVAKHIEHAVSVIGADHVALGSDWDGLICTPRDMPTCLELPRLVEVLLTRGMSDEAVAKILGGSFLRALSVLRGHS